MYCTWISVSFIWLLFLSYCIFTGTLKYRASVSIVLYKYEISQMWMEISITLYRLKISDTTHGSVFFNDKILSVCNVYNVCVRSTCVYTEGETHSYNTQWPVYPVLRLVGCYDMYDMTSSKHNISSNKVFSWPSVTLMYSDIWPGC